MDDDDTYTDDENLDMVLMYGDKPRAIVRAWTCRQCGGYASTVDGEAVHVDTWYRSGSDTPPSP